MKDYKVSILTEKGLMESVIKANSAEEAANRGVQSAGVANKVAKLALGAVCTVAVQSITNGRSFYSYYTYGGQGQTRPYMQSRGSYSWVTDSIKLTTKDGTRCALSNITDDVMEFKYALTLSKDIPGLVSAVNRSKRSYIAKFRLAQEYDNRVILSSTDDLGNVMYLSIDKK